MNTQQIKNLIDTTEYDFLKWNPKLNNNIILLTLGGSYAYGTNNEGSDVDIRGCALNSPTEILTGKDWGTFTNDETDTVIHSFNKLISLLTNVNPNTIEMLGCKPEHYFVLSDAGKLLIENKHLFLSQKCVSSFGGYANQQLWRLNNKAARKLPQPEQYWKQKQKSCRARKTCQTHDASCSSLSYVFRYS